MDPQDVSEAKFEFTKVRKKSITIGIWKTAMSGIQIVDISVSVDCQKLIKPKGKDFITFERLHARKTIYTLRKTFMP